MTDLLPALHEEAKVVRKNLEDAQTEVYARGSKVHDRLIAQAKDIHAEMVRRGDDENAEKLEKIIDECKWCDYDGIEATQVLEYDLRTLVKTSSEPKKRGEEDESLE